MFRAINDALPVGIFVLDSNLRCIYINPRCQQITGLSLEQSANDGWLRIVPEDVRSNILEKWPEELPYRGEMQLMLPDHSVIWVNVLVTAFEEDPASGYLGTLEDITERKATEATRLRRLRRDNRDKSRILNSITSTLPLIIYKVNAKGIVTSSIGAGLKSFGFHDHEIVGRNFFEMYPETADIFRRAMAGEVVRDVSSYIIDGKEAFFHNNVFPDPNNKGGIIGFVLDITSVRQAERELMETNADLQKARRRLERANLLLDASQDLSKVGGWEYNFKTGKAYGTKQMFAIYEVPEDFVATYDNMFDFYEEDERRILKEKLAIALETQMPVVFEQRLITYKKNRKWISGTFLPMVENGQVMMMRGAVMDITKRKEDELELVKAKNTAEVAALAKQQFLSNMSHEIRTPINAIIGMTHLLIQEQPKPEQKEMLEALKFSGDNLLSLINDILDYSKIESGKIVFEEVDFNLRVFLDGIRQSHNLQAEEKGIRFEVRLDDTLPSVIVGDSVRLAQILNNLISNAVKFTQKGSVEVNIRQYKQQGSDVWIDFSVADTGIGIDPSVHDHIFESFTQASADTTRRFGGTGLGLAITKRLLQLQDSDISLDSAQGKGSVFSFRLVFGISAQQHTKNFSSIVTQYDSLKGHSVLLAEDNEVNVLVATRFMQKWEMDIDLASNGQEAVSKVLQQHYDMVLMDLQMPVMDGYEACRLIRAMPEPRFKEIPIIALTASAMAEIKGKVIGAGMNDYVTKPFNPAELYSQIRKYLTI